MDVFILLFTNLLPLYLIIGLGFIAGKYFKIDRETLANFAIYICVPMVVFGFVIQLDLQPAYALLPLITYIMSAIVGFIFLKIGHLVFKDNRANLLSLCTSMGNTGYFGLPLVILLFDEKWIGVYMFLLLGFTLYEGTGGYYVAARGQLTPKDSFIKLAKFPTIYAVTLGLLVNVSGVHMPEVFFTYWGYFKGTYIICGMMIIGCALAKIEKLVIGARFLMLSFLGKFVVWPLLAAAFITLDQHMLHLFEPEIHKLFYIISIVPPAANIAAFAAQMDLRAEKAATTVLIGTIVALFYIPLILSLLHI